MRMIGLGSYIKGLYYLTLKKCSFVSVNSCIHVPDSALWHFRFGHVANKSLIELSKLYPFISVSKHVVCDVCHMAKQKKLPFSVSVHNAKHIFDLVHLDIWGPFRVHSIHNHRYFLTVVDDYSRFTWVVLLKNKGEVMNQVQKFIEMVATQFQVTVKSIRTDNGPEFVLPEYYAKKGIFHQRSCVETPQQNRRDERRHQTLLNIARGLLFQSSLPST